MARYVPLLPAYLLRSQNHDLGTDLHTTVQVYHILVPQADATGSFVVTDRARLISAVDAIQRFTYKSSTVRCQSEPSAAGSEIAGRDTVAHRARDHFGTRSYRTATSSA